MILGFSVKNETLLSLMLLLILSYCIHSLKVCESFYPCLLANSFTPTYRCAIYYLWIIRTQWCLEWMDLLQLSR